MADTDVTDIEYLLRMIRQELETSNQLLRKLVDLQQQ
jgi:hypothetical protein